jgi:hypothetical protein
MAGKASILDPKVRAAKKKKQAIVLGVLLLAVVAFQGPRTMKMLHRSAPPEAAATTPAPTTPAPTAPAAPAAGGTAQSVSASVGGDALVVNADLQPAPLEGQLPDLTLFSSKDPFVQKDADAPAEATTGSGGASSSGGSTAQSSGGKSASAPSGGSGSSTAGGSVTPTPTPTPTPTTTTKPSEPPAAAPTSAVLSVNGVQETVNVKADFPAASPLFHLASLTAKTAKVSIAGGSLATGAPTVTLELGKPTTLMNTADGTRYVLVLVSTSASAASTTTNP